MPYGLTRTQYDALCIIQELIDTTGLAPTHREIANELGLQTASTVPAILRALKARGYIDYLPRRARSIHILRRVPFPPALAQEIGCGMAGDGGGMSDGDRIDLREFERFVAQLRALINRHATINHDQ